MKSATAILVALTVSTSLFLESFGSGSDKLILKDRIVSSNEALQICIQEFLNALYNDTGKYKDGLNKVYKWLTEEFKPLVDKTHAELEQADQGTSDDRKAMANELRKIIDEVLAKLFSFPQIPECMEKVLKEKVQIVIVGNAEDVYEVYSEGKRY